MVMKLAKVEKRSMGLFRMIWDFRSTLQLGGGLSFSTSLNSVAWTRKLR